MTKINRFKRLAAAADVICKGEEEQYERKRLSLQKARQQAERLTAIGSRPDGATMLLPVFRDGAIGADIDPVALMAPVVIASTCGFSSDTRNCR